MDTTGLLADWLADPTPTIVTLAVTIFAGYLYWRGARYARRTGIGKPVRALQAVAFYGALLTLVIAVASPFDALADRSFAAHMAQHAALILMVAPLLLLGDPFWRLWRALPITWRRDSLRWLMQRRRVRHLWGAVEALMRRPAVTLILFLGVFMLWHLPALYDLALRVEVVHGFEHA
ncbi:MAG: cytochrome c oxidase assembly protein, partial [Ktedonobacterales bacterium]